mmetsp:Transcript_17738/g.32038  ORF Transcript_17738/g.32038 Transcript_17738/m.32038 type:complete len:253 (-) Transcript_17738:1712-2470(-)
MIGRLVSCCPALTMSQLASSYLAYYGSSTLHTVSLLTKQVLNHFKNKNSQGAGAFREPLLFFGIMFDALIKCYRKGEDADLAAAKELGKKIAGTLGSGAMRPNQAEKLRDFLLNCVKFALSTPENLLFFDVITIFVQRGFLSPIENKALNDRVQADVNRLEALMIESTMPESLIAPAKNFLLQLSKQAGLRVDMPPPAEVEQTPEKPKKNRASSTGKKKDGEKPSRRSDKKSLVAKKSAGKQPEAQAEQVSV